MNIADKFAKPSQPQASFDQEFDASKVATDIIVLLLTGGMYICYTCNMQRLQCSGCAGRYYAITYHLSNFLDADLGRQQWTHS